MSRSDPASYKIFVILVWSVEVGRIYQDHLLLVPVSGLVLKHKPFTVFLLLNSSRLMVDMIAIKWSLY